MSLANIIISTILKHDAKITSYKIALLRAINDVVLSFPDLRSYQKDVAIPLRVLAQYWVAYYWPFVAPNAPILQGRQAKLKNDISFRPQLTKLRHEWEQIVGGISSPSDGFLLINELRVPRKYQTYPQSLHQSYKRAIASISKAIENPIRYAGPSTWTVFSEPIKYELFSNQVVSIPGTQPSDKCLVIKADLWQTFQEMSLWIEALCIHEWCLFTEKIHQENNQRADRGFVYTLLTDRPGNRQPLTWERHQIGLLLMEGEEFICPWTEKCITLSTEYHLDHILPVSLYPINELWNLVPADPDFNSRIKSDRLPSQKRLQEAQPYFELAYHHYGKSKSLSIALREDIVIRFSTVSSNVTPGLLAVAVVDFINIVAESRNLARF